MGSRQTDARLILLKYFDVNLRLFSPDVPRIHAGCLHQKTFTGSKMTLKYATAFSERANLLLVLFAPLSLHKHTPLNIIKTNKQSSLYSLELDLFNNCGLDTNKNAFKKTM